MSTVAPALEVKSKRKPVLPIKVFCTSAEKQTIVEKASHCGLSASTFLRRVALGLEVTNTNDHRQIEALIKVNGDLGRLEEVLTQILSNTEKFGLDKNILLKAKIRDTLEGIHDDRTVIRSIIRAVVKV